MSSKALAEKLELSSWDGDTLARAALERIVELETTLADLHEGRACVLPKTREHALNLLTVAEALVHGRPNVDPLTQGGETNMSVKVGDTVRVACSRWLFNGALATVESVEADDIIIVRWPDGSRQKARRNYLFEPQR